MKACSNFHARSLVTPDPFAIDALPKEARRQWKSDLGTMAFGAFEGADAQLGALLTAGGSD
eukprot:11790747-Alexandrium_andersonii.AAC.1